MDMAATFYKMLAHHLFASDSLLTTYPVHYVMKTIDTKGGSNVGVGFLYRDENNNLQEYGSNYGHNFSATANVTCDIADTGVTITGEYTITNNGDTDMTIDRVKLKGWGCQAGNTFTGYIHYGNYGLDTPVVIPAGGGIGKVTHTCTFTYPTA